MFMVFTTAAGDEQQTIVKLAFETIEKIVREHFDFITETEITTFTDCVNCLIAFTNNPHSIDVSLNAIAFLRFCAMKLAEGAIGEPFSFICASSKARNAHISFPRLQLLQTLVLRVFDQLVLAFATMLLCQINTEFHAKRLFTMGQLPRTTVSMHLGLALHDVCVCVCGVPGDVELELPEGTPDFDPDRNRIRPSAGEPDEDTWVSNSRRTTFEGGLPTVPEGGLDQRTSNGSIKLLSDLAPQQLAAAQQEQQKGLQVSTLYTHSSRHCLSVMTVCWPFFPSFCLSAQEPFCGGGQFQTFTLSSGQFLSTAQCSAMTFTAQLACLFSCKCMAHPLNTTFSLCWTVAASMVPATWSQLKRCLGEAFGHASGDVYLKWHLQHA